MHSSPLATVLASRLTLYIQEKYGARLSGVGWDEETQRRFVRGEAHIFLRDGEMTVEEPDLNLTVEGAVEMLWGPEPDAPLAKVIDINSRRDTRR